jgi:streptolysin S family bacteriocin protoxin
VKYACILWLPGFVFFLLFVLLFLPLLPFLPFLDFHTMHVYIALITPSVVCLVVCVCVCVKLSPFQAHFSHHGGHLPPVEHRVSVNQQMHDLSMPHATPTAIPTPTQRQLRLSRLYLTWCKMHKNILYLTKLVRHSASRRWVSIFCCCCCCCCCFLVWKGSSFLVTQHRIIEH